VARQRAHEQRLQQPALGIAAHRSQREEYREDRAEEEDREHRQPGQRRADHRLGVDPELRARRELVRRLERLPGGEPVQAEEHQREQPDDDEHAPPQRLPQAEAGDDQRAAEVHAATSGTARRPIASR
jgi:hypothetical protein